MVSENKNGNKMKSTPSKLEIVSPVGTFEFAPHHSDSEKFSFIEAMWNFDANNWELLLSKGEYHYALYLKFEDGEETKTEFKGINASADLSCFLDDDFNRNNFNND